MERGVAGFGFQDEKDPGDGLHTLRRSPAASPGNTCAWECPHQAELGTQRLSYARSQHVPSHAGLPLYAG